MLYPVEALKKIKNTVNLFTGKNNWKIGRINILPMIKSVKKYK